MQVYTELGIDSLILCFKYVLILNIYGISDAVSLYPSYSAKWDSAKWGEQLPYIADTYFHPKCQFNQIRVCDNRIKSILCFIFYFIHSKVCQF